METLIDLHTNTFHVCLKQVHYQCLPQCLFSNVSNVMAFFGNGGLIRRSVICSNTIIEF